MGNRITVDTGGTFTDLALVTPDGRLFVGKSPTTADAFEGLLGALGDVAGQMDSEVRSVLGDTDLFVYSTTRATNAILESRTAKTALLVTEGFPDVLVIREGGKTGPFDLTNDFPAPYVPRRLTFEIGERIGGLGEVRRPLDEVRVREAMAELRALEVEAVAVCLLSAHVNPAHEIRLGELLGELLPEVPYTLSHEINPVVREYRRASSAAIDASLKPLMSAHLGEINTSLRDAGFGGDLMAATSIGGIVPIEELAQRPLLSVRSGPSMAPVAGLAFAMREAQASEAIVCDTGGTSFDVSLVRDGKVSYTADTWLGPRFTGHLTGAPSVDIRSIGAGGGSIAWVDSGGLLHVGPRSAGAVPGPACYGRGGSEPTVTDAAVVLGYVDPEGFLGGRMRLDSEAAEAVLGALGEQLGLSAQDAAAAILTLFNEHMVGAIQEITVHAGVDPRESLIVAGGGASGLGILELARELGCDKVVVPRTAGALSAVGGQCSDIVAEFAASHFATTAAFDADGVNRILDGLDAKGRDFLDRLDADDLAEVSTEYLVDARYGYQVWLLELPLPRDRFAGPADVELLRQAFDRAHDRIFAVTDESAEVEFQTWRARLTARPHGGLDLRRAIQRNGRHQGPRTVRPAHFGGIAHDTPVFVGDSLAPGARVEGPAIVEEPTTTLVVPPETAVTVSEIGSYRLDHSHSPLQPEGSR